MCLFHKPPGWYFALTNEADSYLSYDMSFLFVIYLGILNLNILVYRVLMKPTFFYLGDNKVNAYIHVYIYINVIRMHYCTL